MKIISMIIGIFLAALWLLYLGIRYYVFSKKICFKAYPRIPAYGDINKVRYIHLNGFHFIISNDLWGKNIVYRNEAVNMAFQYNLKPELIPSEILSNKKPLNIEILDITTNNNLSYSVPHSNKIKAILFFKNYRELIQRIYEHKNKTNNL
ncbi:MAG: hypothetical protein ACI37S_02115 [Candidatus Gastranaerophilaceae bacterium]